MFKNFYFFNRRMLMLAKNVFKRSVPKEITQLYCSFAQIICVLCLLVRKIKN